MSVAHEFYSSRAAEARADADSAMLANVRDRCLRSAAAWEAMAARALLTEKHRTRRESEKAAAEVDQDAD